MYIFYVNTIRVEFFLPAKIDAMHSKHKDQPQESDHKKREFNQFNSLSTFSLFFIERLNSKSKLLDGVFP